MQAHLHAFFQQLEQQRQEFSEWVVNAPDSRQHHVPQPGQWSAAQLLYHLAQVDQQVILGLEKRLASGKALRPVRTSTRIKSFLLNLFLRLPIKFKAPPAVREVPEQVEVPEVVQQWQDMRARLHQILLSYPEHQLDKEIFFHPRSGMLTLPQTLRFMVEHTEHHRRQMKRLLS
ncbi:DinB family protein [Rufibacter immobilis]|uniref:DinB family protein n=1 Tax=Rufibacter immobilis TaxID=1348778 RepID=A0A3M9MTI8_9BACT|nr:DinB family protein [Rufibacter immobilis]RNI28048.1 DinB family protein [Rufibacter immobilis]